LTRIIPKKETLTLILIILLSVFPFNVQVQSFLAASGNILIGTKIAPSPVITIGESESVSLYFGYVTWNSVNYRVAFYLSSDGNADLLPPDFFKYGSEFQVPDIQKSGITTVDRWLY